MGGPAGDEAGVGSAVVAGTPAPAPHASGGRGMIIAQITDLHIKPHGRLAYRKVDTAAHLERAVAYLNALDPRPDVVVATGDLVDAGTAEEYERLRSLLAPLAVPYFLVPGNHDHRETLQAVFSHQPWLAGHDGFIEYAIDDFPVRLVGIDTTAPMIESGVYCNARAAWLDGTLARSDKPTVVFMHHPPFATGMAYHDGGRMANREALAAVIARHGQVKWLLCGHVHRAVTVSWAGVPASAVSSTAHQLILDLRDDAELMFALEPPALQQLVWIPAEGMVAHVCPIGDFDGPHPIFENGRIIL